MTDQNFMAAPLHRRHGVEGGFRRVVEWSSKSTPNVLSRDLDKHTQLPMHTCATHFLRTSAVSNKTKGIARSPSCALLTSATNPTGFAQSLSCALLASATEPIGFARSTSCALLPSATEPIGTARSPSCALLPSAISESHLYHT